VVDRPPAVRARSIATSGPLDAVYLLSLGSADSLHLLLDLAIERPQYILAADGAGGILVARIWRDARIGSRAGGRSCWSFSDWRS